MKNSTALVLFADANYLDPAKALIYGAVSTGKWSQDIVFVPYPDVSDEEASWFTQRGIIVKRFEKAVDAGEISNIASAQFNKLNLFDTYFKRWRRVVYLDCDIMIFREMSQLLRLDCGNTIMVDGEDWPEGLASQFLANRDPTLFEQLKTEFGDISVKNFNTSSMVFDTNLIQTETLPKLLEITQKYLPIIRTSDQSTLNLFFYQKWKQLPKGTIAFIGNPNPLGMIVHVARI